MYAKLHPLLERYWFSLPLLSAILLILSFHPFNVWPLGFVALAPLYYFVAGFPNRPITQVFWGGFITGVLFAFSLSYFTVVQFQWLPEAYLFATLVRFSFVPIAILGGLMGGGFSMLGYRYLLDWRSILWGTLLGAAAYSAGEMALTYLFGGYFFALLAYVASDVGPLRELSAVGGVFFVSFVVAWCNSFVAAFFLFGRSRTREYLRSAAVALGTLVVLWAGSTLYLAPQDEPLRVFSVATIQAGSRDGMGFGKEERGVFSFPALEERLVKAAAQTPDLIIYPFSPVEGAFHREVGQKSFTKQVLVSSEDSFARWLTPLASSSTVMIWTTLYEEGRFHNDFEFWWQGEKIAQYRKRQLFPFIDYTPQWAQDRGFFSTSIDTFSGPADARLELDGMPVGALLCSEIVQQSLARRDAARALFLVSAGSEAIFIDDVASEFSLKATQFRAAENNIPVIRANLLGPSAVIDRRGGIIAELAHGESGLLQATLELHTPRPTLFSYAGNTLIITLVVGILVVAYLRARFFGITI